MDPALAFWLGVFTLWMFQWLDYLSKRSIRKNRERRNSNGYIKG